MKIFLSLLITLSVSWVWAADREPLVFSSVEGKILSWSEFVQKVPATANVVLGEVHYTPIIQQAEADVILAVTKNLKLEQKVTVGWEFLNFSDQQIIEEYFEKFKKDEISTGRFLESFFGNKDQGILAYSPVLEAAKTVNAEFLGLNAPRSIKTLLRKDGFAALPEAFVPPDFQLGSDSYFERFEALMGGHGSKETLKSYFLAQSYTDEVMAWKTETVATRSLRFLIAGAFHVDYNDGFVQSLKRRSKTPTISVKLIDATDFSANDIQTIIMPDEKYGPLADYILFL